MAVLHKHLLEVLRLVSCGSVCETEGSHYMRHRDIAVDHGNKHLGSEGEAVVFDPVSPGPPLCGDLCDDGDDDGLHDDDGGAGGGPQYGLFAVADTSLCPKGEKSFNNLVAVKSCYLVQYLSSTFGIRRQISFFITRCNDVGWICNLEINQLHIYECS